MAKQKPKRHHSKPHSSVKLTQQLALQRAQRNQAALLQADLWARQDTQRALWLDVRICFRDGTVIRVGYSKPNLGVWYIIVEQAGHAAQTLTECMDEDADVYSDVFEIDSEVLTHEVVRKEAAQ